METGTVKRILLVDDEPLSLQALARDLRSQPNNYQVAVQAGGAGAISTINQQPYDMVVTDLMMPEMDGFQVLKAAKRRDPQTMVVILTGYADINSAIDALRLGADEFLPKPCTAEELAYRIDNCFHKQELLRKLTMYETFLPICSYCKKIKDTGSEPEKVGQSHWYQLEEYLEKIQGVTCSHGCCPECFNRVMAEIADGEGGGRGES